MAGYIASLSTPTHPGKPNVSTPRALEGYTKDDKWKWTVHPLLQFEATFLAAVFPK